MLISNVYLFLNAWSLLVLKSRSSSFACVVIDSNCSHATDWADSACIKRITNNFCIYLYIKLMHKFVTFLISQVRVVPMYAVSGKVWYKHGFLISQKVILTSIILHVWKDYQNLINTIWTFQFAMTIINHQLTREYGNTMNCDLPIKTFAFHVKSSEIACIIQVPYDLSSIVCSSSFSSSIALTIFISKYYCWWKMVPLHPYQEQKEIAES